MARSDSDSRVASGSYLSLSKYGRDGIGIVADRRSLAVGVGLASAMADGVGGGATPRNKVTIDGKALLTLPIPQLRSPDHRIGVSRSKNSLPPNKCHV